MTSMTARNLAICRTVGGHKPPLQSKGHRHVNLPHSSETLQKREDLTLPLQI